MRKFIFGLFILVVSLFPARAYALPEALEILPEGQILVILDERRIYFKPAGGGDVYFIPIAVGRPGMDRGILGVWEITRSKEWPTWTPTPAMLARDCAKYCKWANGMPGGPDNPLGAHALYLGTSHYRIHGTNDPDSIGEAVSSGCIRLRNEHVTWLAEQVGIGATVIVVRALDDYLGEVPVGGTFADESDAEEEVITSLY